MAHALQKEMNLQRYFLSKLTSFVVMFDLLIFKVITLFWFYGYFCFLIHLRICTVCVPGNCGG